jgi:hypothetical protein
MSKKFYKRNKNKIRRNGQQTVEIDIQIKYKCENDAQARGSRHCNICIPKIDVLIIIM